MVDKLIDTAMLFKAKLKKDELEELLIEATSEDNWQTPTPILHKIANASYNHDDEKRIFDFIIDKFKGKKWKKVLKSLSLVDFLLKNGSSSAVEDFRSELYLFKSFETFSCVADGVDRSEAIRQKTKMVIEMLVNSEHLEEERVKASNIKQKMGLSNNYPNSRYEAPNKSSATSSSVYQGMGSSSHNNDVARFRRQDPESDSYSDKLKTGFNQVSDYLKTSYNKVNWNDVGGYIKDKVTNPSVVDHRDNLLNDGSDMLKKTSSESNSMSQQYKPPSGSGAGLFANLNVKRTTGLAINPKPVTPTVVNSAIGNKPLIKPSGTTSLVRQPVSKPQQQQIDLFSFDDVVNTASVSKKQSNPENQDIFSGFDEVKPKIQTQPTKKIVNTPVNDDIFGGFEVTPQPKQVASNFDILGNDQPLKQTPPVVTPPVGNVFGDFNVNMISGGAKQQNHGSFQNGAAQIKPSANNSNTKASDVSWLSQAETNLIDFSDMSTHENKQQQASAPTPTPAPVQPVYNMMNQPQQPMYNMMGYPQPQPHAYGQPYPAAYPANYGQAQVPIPANQYEQFQQFLLFQQQQQQAALKGKY